jgi:hypothetical protein
MSLLSILVVAMWLPSPYATLVAPTSSPPTATPLEPSPFNAKHHLLKKTWILNQKSEAFYSDTHFYVFVSLRGELERPVFHIVPSKIVAKYVEKSHKEWLKGKSKSGKPHKDSAIRNFSDKEDVHLEKWELLVL